MRIAYIGAGGFTSYFIHPQLHMHNVELAAICDLDLLKAWKAQRAYGFTNAYSDHIAMIETEKPDAVFCVGGPAVHLPVGLDVLKRGFPLYVQKPAASTSEGARQLAEAARAAGVVCHVGFNMRSAPAVLAARKIQTEAEWGSTLAGIFRYGLASHESMRFNVIDQHCHILDLARYLMGNVADVNVMRSGRENSRDYVVTVRFESGAVASINLTSGQPFEKEFMFFELTGQNSLCYSHGGNELRWRRAMQHPWWQNPTPEMVYGIGAFGLQNDLASFGYVGDVDNFLAAVRGEQEDRSPVQDTIATMELCEEILRQMGNPE
jgi:myo-inositol 2-dehydrogenase/D-chiro-inositol 1-dehydrogenase